MKKLLLKTFLLLLVSNGHAVMGQSLLTLQSAIDTALYNNLGLVISRNEALIAANNLSLGNAGMLPRLDLNAGANFANNNLKQEFNTGVEINKNNVGSKAYNGQLALNWTLFDGTRMFVTYQKLEVLKNMGELYVQARTEEIISDVIKSYSEIVRQKILLKGTLNTITLYEERLKLANTRLMIGKSPRTEFLQASIDLNVQKSALLKQTTALKAAKTSLNGLLLKPLNADYEVSDSLMINKTLALQDVLNGLDAGNRQLLLLQMLEEQRVLEIKEQQSFSYPRVTLNAGYNFVSNSSTQGLFLVNQSRGPVAGFTFNWNLFNGIQRKQVENTKLVHENSKLGYENARVSLQTMVINAWNRYKDAIELADNESANYKMAGEYLYITMERFKLNEATILELKDAQVSHEASVIRLANTLYDAKTAETELFFLTGRLIKSE